MGCLKPHRRVDDSATAWALKERLGMDLEEKAAGIDPFWKSWETHTYVRELFAHLTRGRKVLDVNEEQYCPAPVPPAHWSADELFEADAFTIQHTFRRELDA